MKIEKIIFVKIEEACAHASSETTGTLVKPCNLYEGRGKTPFSVSMARALAFVFMHDHYGINYRRIAERSRMTVNAVMKCMVKARELRFIDPTYKECYERIEKML